MAPRSRDAGLNVELDDEGDSVFEPRQQDDGSPGRIIVTMVGIVGILLLGSLFWSAVGALFGALGAATEAFPFGRGAPPLVLSAQPTSTPRPVPTHTPAATATPVALVARAASTITPTPEPTSPPPSATPTVETVGRAPWVLLPQPAPDSTVSAGPMTIEARGRGDAAITEIRLELDGAPLAVDLEQRGDSVWRGAASVRVAAGQHTARAVVVDERGRSGSFRWRFDAGP